MFCSLVNLSLDGNVLVKTASFLILVQLVAYNITLPAADNIAKLRSDNILERR